MLQLIIALTVFRADRHLRTAVRPERDASGVRRALRGRPRTRLEPDILSVWGLVSQSVLLAIAVRDGRLARADRHALCPPAIRAMQANSALRATALLYLLFALTIVSSSEIPALAQMMPSGLSDVLLQNDREDVAPHRILHFPDPDVPVHLVGPARLGIPAILRPAADHQMWRGMAGRVLCRRVPLPSPRT